jgi:hypothetical protein
LENKPPKGGSGGILGLFYHIFCDYATSIWDKNRKNDLLNYENEINREK